MLDRTDLSLTERIGRLIYQRILGVITAEEVEELDSWRDANPANEVTYQKLLDTAFLEREYKRLRAVKVDRPLADMEKRVRYKSVRGYRRLLWQVSSAAAVLLFITSTLLYLNTRPDVVLSEKQETEMYAAQIRPGETKAVLMLNNGVELELGADQEKNQVAIQQIRTVSKKEKILNNLTTPRGGEFKITLEDGTQVWLNAESQLIYPDTFSANERRVILKGEAYFEVVKDEQKPFYVESNGQVVRVYGTEFNVRSYEEDADIYTTLVSGRVSLQSMNGNEAELILTPGKQAVFDKRQRSTSVRPVDTQVVTSWRRGMFVFEEQNLEQIMRDLSRWYNFSYEFKDTSLRETVFMGSVPRYGDFNEILEILEKSGGVKFRVKDRVVIISAL